MSITLTTAEISELIAAMQDAGHSSTEYMTPAKIVEVAGREWGVCTDCAWTYLLDQHDGMVQVFPDGTLDGIQIEDEPRADRAAKIAADLRSMILGEEGDES